MAGQKIDKKRKRNRKARTEVSSSSESSDSEQQSTSQVHEQSTQDPEGKRSTSPCGSSEQGPVAEAEGPVLVKKVTKDPEDAFNEFYLKQTTKEFANDLDKLRSANDFSDRSIPMLIEALKQGRSCFSTAERQRLGNATGCTAE